MPIQRQDVEYITELLNERNYKVLRSVFDDMNSVDLASAIESLPQEQALIAFRTLPKETEAEVFAEFDSDMQQKIVEAITDTELSRIIDDLWVDDAVDMIEEMPAQLVNRVLRNSSPETRSLINQFLNYPENSAGSVMTSEFTKLSKDMTVKEAIEHIRKVGEDRETIYTCYVVDADRHLEGKVTVKELLLANDNELIKNIMETEQPFTVTTDDREDAAKLLAKYDLIALPVVDAQNHLVGIITIDDALDVLREETTEDFHKMAAISPSEKPYLKTSVFRLAANRFVWLLCLMLSGMVTGAILGSYEAVYSSIPVLVSFMPMLTGTGGNAGSQSSTMVIRGMALGEIKVSDIFYVVWKEFRISIIVGIILAAANYIRLLIMYGNLGLIPLVVALAQIGAIIMAKTIGSILPIVAKMLKIDPAIMAAPLITTIVDAVTLVLYYSIAEKLLM